MRNDILSDDAVVGLPTYLTVAVIIAAVILAVFSISVYGLLSDSQMHQIKCEIDKIVSEAENMFEYADEGTAITLHIIFPNSMKYVVFGSLPNNSNSEPVDLELDENTSNNYYFVTNDGDISIGHSHARFSSNDTSKISVFHSRTYDLKLELENVNGTTYVKVY